MRYIYNVVYYVNKSLFCTHIYDNEFFSSRASALEHVNFIVKEEELSVSNENFMSHKIKIVKRPLDVLEEDVEPVIHIYDLRGVLIYSSNIKKDSKKFFKKKFSIGDIVEIMPFPWCSDSPVDLIMFGVIVVSEEDEYILYTVDDCKVIHLHASEACLDLISSEESSKVPAVIKELRGVIIGNKKATISDESIKISMCLGKIDK